MDPVEIYPAWATDHYVDKVQTTLYKASFPLDVVRGTNDNLMMNTLTKIELTNVLGGENSTKRDDLCAEIQEMASRHGDSWSSKQWDEWGEMFDRQCGGGKH